LKTDTEGVETSPIRRASRATFPLRGKVDGIPYAIALRLRGKGKILRFAQDDGVSRYERAF